MQVYIFIEDEILFYVNLLFIAKDQLLRAPRMSANHAMCNVLRKLLEENELSVTSCPCMYEEWRLFLSERGKYVLKI